MARLLAARGVGYCAARMSSRSTRTTVDSLLRAVARTDSVAPSPRGGAGAPVVFAAQFELGAELGVHDLDRDVAIEPAIVGLVDHAHAALADQAPHLEPVVAVEAAGAGAVAVGRGARARGARRRHQAIVLASRLRAA